MLEKTAVTDEPLFPFWLSTEKYSLMANDNDSEIKLWRLVKLKEVPYPEWFKNRLVKLFKIYGFKEPLNQIYVPFYLKGFGGKMVEGEADYSGVDWTKAYTWFFVHILVNFTKYGLPENSDEFCALYNKLREKALINSYRPIYVKDFDERL
jgi:hypothetical protein